MYVQLIVITISAFNKYMYFANVAINVVKQMDESPKYETSVVFNDFLNKHCLQNDSFTVPCITTNEI